MHPTPDPKTTATRRAALLSLADHAEQAFARAFAEVLTQADNVLYELAESELQSRQQNALLETRVLLRGKRDAVVKAARQRLKACGQMLLGRSSAAAPAPESTKSPIPSHLVNPLDSLSLVDDAALEAELTVKGIAGRLLDKLDNQLALLTARVGVLSANPDMVVPDNPLAPFPVLTALDEALSDCAIEQPDRQRIWHALEAMLQTSLEASYRDLNQRLAGQGVLPELKSGFVKRVGSGQSGARPSTKPSAAAPGATSPAPTAASGGAPGSAGAANGHRAPVGGLGIEGALAGMSRRAAPAASPAPFPNYFPGVALPFGGGQALISQAELLFSGHPAAVPVVDSAGGVWIVPTHQMAFWGAVDSWMPAPVDVAVSLGAPPPRGYGVGLPAGAKPSLSTPSVLWQAREAPAAASLSEIETLTIDIVAMLFDHIFDDENISIPIKSVLAKLQVPVLKLAMNDRGFFSNRAHPARLLLDELARVGMGCGPSAGEGDPIFGEISTLVERIVRMTELSGASVRAELEAFQASVSEVEYEARAFLEQSQRVAEERSQRESARATAEAAVVARTADHPLPPEVRQMLEQTWPQVMMRAFARGGEESPAWQEAISTVEELVWSLAPKTTSDERNRMLSVLPHLLRRLQEGINTVGLDPATRDRFFNVLVDCHSRAMDVDREAEAGSGNYAEWLRDVDLKARAEAPQVPEMERLRVSELGVRIEEIRLRLRGRITLPTSELGLTLPLPKLEVGQWVEFHDDDALGDEVLRAKLTWVSPLANVYLFTNTQLGEAVSISQTALAAQIMAGVTRLLDDSPVMDRAVGGVRSSLGISASVSAGLA